MKRNFVADPRDFQICFQILFLLSGILVLHWKVEWVHYLVTIISAFGLNYLAESLRQNKRLPFKLYFENAGLSILISAASLCLLLKTNHPATSLLAVVLTISSKYLIRYKNQHLFNPSAFGIAATLLLSSDAWLSPGQWGSHFVLVLFICTLGTIIVTKVQKLDISLAFLCTFILLLAWRQLFVLSWPTDHFIHSVASGSLLIFSFFMISDPKTTPHHALGRICYGIIVACLAFYLSVFKWMQYAPLFSLVITAPLVPLINMLFKSNPFKWFNEQTFPSIFYNLNRPS